MRKEFKVLAIRSLLALLVLTGIFGVFSFLVGEFDEWQWKVLGTLFILVSLCISVLCSSLLLGTRYSPVGSLGTIISALATLSLLTLVWWEYDYSSVVYQTLIEPLAKFTAITVTFSLSFVITSLLLHLTRQRTPVIAKALWATIGFVLADALIVSLFIIAPSLVTGESFLLRLLGATSVAATVGVIATPIMALITKGKKIDRQDHPVEEVEQV